MITIINIIEQSVRLMSQSQTCSNCSVLHHQLEEQRQRAKELEDVNEKLTNEITALMQLSASPLGSSSLDPEIELKKGIFNQLLSSSGQSALTKSLSTEYDDSGSSSNGANLKKIQQELRVSKKAEQLAKEKLTQTKRSLDKMEKDFSKYRDDSEARIETLKTELSILQKHYDQMQNSGNDLDSLVGGSFPFNLGNLAGTSNNSGEKQFLSSNRESSQQQTAAELLKVIDDYSRQNDSKSKDIEALRAKLDSKHSKIRDLKKKYSEMDSLVTKLRATLENVKNFLKLLNQNFIKSMKQQNIQLKESILQSQNDILKDIDQFKGSIGTQIIRITQKKEKDIASNIYNEQIKSNELAIKIQNLKSEHQEMLQSIKKEHEDNVQSMKDQHLLKVKSLKQKIKILSDEKANNVQQNNSVIEQLHIQIQGLEKQVTQLDLQLQTEKDRLQLVIADVQRESNHKSTLIDEFKNRESLSQKKLEEQESRSRQEIEKLQAKLELASTQGLDKSLATQLIQQKETLLAQELQIYKESQEKIVQQLKEMYDSKLKERDLDCEKLRMKSADDLSILKSQHIIELKDKETQISTAQSQLQDFQSRLQKKASKIHSLKSDLQKNLQQFDSEKQALRDNFNLQKVQLEQKQVQLENELLQLRAQFDNSQIKLQEIQALHDQEKDDLLKQIQEKDQKNQKDMEIQNHEIVSIIPAQSSINKHQINNREDMYQRETSIRSERPSNNEPQPPAPSNQESSRGSSKEHQYEGGQDEKKEEQEGGGPPQQSNLPPMQAQIRPPLRPQAPMAAVRGRGMPPHFRPPVGVPHGIRPTAQPRPTAMFNSNTSPRQQRSTLQQHQEAPTPSQQEIQQEVKAQISNQKEPVAEMKQDSPRPIINKPIVEETKAVQQENTEKNNEETKLPTVQKTEEPQRVQTFEKIDQKSDKEEEKKEKERSQSQAPPPMAQNPEAQGANNRNLLDFKNNRFFGMLNSFLTLLSRRKQGYTGRSASAMYYDEKRARYVIQGEDESDDDVPPPPPPKKQQQEVEKKEEEKKVTPQQPANAADALAQPAFAGALANRGRGRGRGGAMMNRFPQTFNPSQLQESSLPPIEEQKQEIIKEKLNETINAAAGISQDLPVLSARPSMMEENSELYTTGLDITMLNQTTIFKEQDQKQFQSADYKEVSLLQQTTLQHSIIMDEPMEEKKDSSISKQEHQMRESEWEDKFQQQQDKINNMKYKISMLQQELRNERDQNEQTIENFTVLCQDLKFKGMDEVEDLQCDISILKEHLKTLAHEKAYHQVKLSQLSDSVKFYQEENLELTQQLREYKFKLLQQQIDQEFSKTSSQDAEQSADTTQLEEQLNSFKSTNLDLQLELDSYKWKTTILEAEKLQKTLDVRDLQLSHDKQRNQIQSLESENFRLQTDLRRIQIEQAHYGQEQVAKLEREKEAIKEMMQKVQNEKERLQEQVRERVSEYETKIKKLESDKQRAELDQARALREREGAIDQIKNQNLSINQNLQQSLEENKWLHAQVRELQSKIASLNAKRQNESEQAELFLKVQLKQAQEMLNQRSQQAEHLASKHEEMSQELQQMDAMRHKLTENIIYLQNEIRKRDDLLENSSEFGGDFEMIGDDDDDCSSNVPPEEELSSRGGGGDILSMREADSQREGLGGAGHGGSSLKHSFQMIRKQTNKRRTQNQALQNQLDETRQQLKVQIEERLKSVRSQQNIEHTFRKLLEGLFDINKILDSQHKSMIEQAASSSLLEGEQSSSLFDDNIDTEEESKYSSQIQNDNIEQLLETLQPDDTVHSIISKVFSLQRAFDSELSELKHKLKMQQMQIEESESLKFDIEILNDEKNLLDSDNLQLTASLKDLEQQNSQLQHQVNLLRQQTDHQLKSLQDQYEKQLSRQRTDFEQQIQQHINESQRKLAETHETFKSQLLPALKEKYKSKYQKLEGELSELRLNLTQQLDDERRAKSELEFQHQSFLNQTSMQIEHNNEEADRLREQLEYKDINIQELKNQILQLTYEKDSQIKQLSDHLGILREEEEQLKVTHQREIEKYVKGFDDVILKLKAKGDQKKKKLKEYKKIAVERIREMEEKFNEEKEELLRVKEIEKEQKLSDEALQEFKAKEEQWTNQEAGLKERISQLEQELSQNQKASEEQLQQLAQATERQSIDFQERESSLTLQLTKLQEQLETLQDTSVLESNTQVNQLQSELTLKSEQIVSLTSQLTTAASDFEVKLNESIKAKQSELDDKVSLYTQREEQFKSQTKQVVQELKSKIKQEKEKLGKLDEELKSTVADKRVLEQQILELKRQHQHLVQERSQNNEAQIKKLEETIRKLEEEVEYEKGEVQRRGEQVAQSQQVIEEMRLTIGEMLESLGIESSQDWLSLVEKLREVLNNYEEDKRQMRALIDERERLSSISEQQQTEIEKILEEKIKLEDQIQHSDAFKLKMKVKQLEEEKSELKNDFFIKINSYIEENSILSQRLQNYEPVVKQNETEDEASIEEQKESFIESKHEEPSFVEGSQIHKGDQSTLNPQQKSGIFNSIASFFLTESELQNQDQ